MSNSSVDVYQRSTYRTILLSLFTSLLLPSYLCSLFIFYNCIRMPQLRKGPQNRFILTFLFVLFIQALFDVPCRIYYLYNGTVPIHNTIFCQIWYLVVTITDIIGLHLMALFSIERYLLIFHRRFLTRYRFLLSSLPMIIFIGYPTIWYITVMYASSLWCTYTPNYSVTQCGMPCYLLTSTFCISFIIYVHHLLPVFTITFANLYLIISVLYQKSKMKQNRSWRKNLRMASQLLSIAFFYLTVWLPHCILASFPLYATPSTTIKARLLKTEYFENFLSIFICLCPFIVLTGLPKLHEKLKQIFCLCHNQRMSVVPFVLNCQVP